MDNLNKKLKKLFTPKPKKFRGQGNVLGSRPEVRCIMSLNHLVKAALAANMASTRLALPR